MAHGCAGTTCRLQEGEPEMNSSQEQAKLAKMFLPVGSKGLYFTVEQELWTLAFVLV